MPLLPKSLHILWLHQFPPERVLKNVLNWVAESNELDVYFWVRAAQIASCARTLDYMSQDNLLLKPYEAPEEASGQRYPLAVDVVGEEHGFKMYFNRLSRPEFTGLCRVMPIECVPAMFEMHNFWATVEDADFHKVAIDVAKIWVLNKYGGVCIDYDTVPFEQKYNCNVEAPKGILFYQLRNYQTVVLTPAVIGCLPQHPMLWEIATRMQLALAGETYRERPVGHYYDIEKQPANPNAELEHVRDMVSKMNIREAEERFEMHNTYSRLIDLQQERMLSWKTLCAVIMNNEMGWQTPEARRQASPCMFELELNRSVLLQYSFSAATGYEHAVETEPYIKELF